MVIVFINVNIEELSFKINYFISLKINDCFILTFLCYLFLRCSSRGFVQYCCRKSITTAKKNTVTVAGNGKTRLLRKRLQLPYAFLSKLSAASSTMEVDSLCRTLEGAGGQEREQWIILLPVIVRYAPCSMRWVDARSPG